MDRWWERQRKRLGRAFHHVWRWLGDGSDFLWTRFLILRVLGLSYTAAFLSLALQVEPLLGSNGLTPVTSLLDSLQANGVSTWQGLQQAPSLFWFGVSDGMLVALAWIGLLLSVLVLLGLANVPIMASLWVLYLSYVELGQVWYGYGWEMQLLETGFLAMFLVPLWDPRPFSRKNPSPLVIWLFRWLAFRIFLGAGLIKIRGDSCWMELTCLSTHFETQPIPNPASPFLDAAPSWMHKSGVAFNHVVELLVPFTIVMGRMVRGFGGVLMVVFQLMLIVSGNLSFLNYLSIAAAVSYFDDMFLRWLTPDGWFDAWKSWPPGTSRRVLVVLFAVLVAVLSVPIVSNLMSGSQAMNASYDPLNLVNTYGAFGSVTEQRVELLVQGTRDTSLDGNTTWRTYRFHAKPDRVNATLPVVAPYQPRLSWQFWFASMSRPSREPWLLHLVWKLLQDDPMAERLTTHDPFSGSRPTAIRIMAARYRFAPPLSNRTWIRGGSEVWLPPVTRNTAGLEQMVERRFG